MENIDMLKRTENQILLNLLCDNKENVNGNIAHCRDTYLISENDYLNDTLKDENTRNLIRELNQMPSDLLYEEAEELIYNVENNLIPEDEMNSTELKLLVLLGSIQDKILEMGPIVKLKELEEESIVKTR